MKNKKLAIFLIIFSILLAFVILSSAIFSLKSVTVQFMSETSVLKDTDEEIVKSGDFKMGESIFLSNKKEFTKNLEKANPYLRVVNIETKFPSKLVIHAVERSECYVIKLSNSKYAVTDEYMKVLRTTNVYQNNASNGIEVKNSGLENQSVEEGDFFESSDYLKTLFDCFREWKKAPTYSDVREKIASVELDYEKSGQLLVNMRSGVQIVVENSKIQLSDKINLAFSIYDTTEKNGAEVDYTKDGIIYILENEQSIYGLYRPVE